MGLHPSVQDKAIVGSDEVHSTTEKALVEVFPEVTINGDAYTEQDISDVLLYASVNCTTIKGACERPKGFLSTTGASMRLLLMGVGLPGARHLDLVQKYFPPCIQKEWPQ